jgi:urease accessory protein UreF
MPSPALYRLMAWLSPAFPVGAFSYSSGIEWAVEAGDIKDADVQIAGGKIRIRRDHVLEDMLRGLGAHLTPLEAPFDPEAAAPHSHENHHGG